MDNDHKKKILVAVVLNAGQLFKSFIDNENNLDEEVEARTRKIPLRISNYIENVIPQIPEKQFQSHFRINRGTYNYLLQLLNARIKKESVLGRTVIDVDRQLLSVLWLLATPDSYRSVGERFNMGKTSLSNSFFRVIRCLNELSSEIIKWPETREREQIKRMFKNMGGIEGIIGIIDGTYIPIKAPKVDAEIYVTRKCQHAMTLQATCDPLLKFTDCFIGYPRSVSDARIFRNSDVFQKVQENKARYFENNEFILGDKAYPTLSWCIPPYIERGNVSNARKYFNKRHSQTRQTIERTFALLFGRFRRLKYLDMNKTSFIPATVLAACVLHNLCIKQHDAQLEEYIADGRTHVRGCIDIGGDGEYIIDNGVDIRENICRHLLESRI